jgi:NAD(P)H-flavin reductase
MPKTIDNKQKQVLLDKIYADHPELQRDTLKKYCIEKVMEAYLLDPDAFNKKTAELMKKEKKKAKNEEEKTPDKVGENEIICITRIPAEENEPQNLTITEGGMIKPVQ